MINYLINRFLAKTRVVSNFSFTCWKICPDMQPNLSKFSQTCPDSGIGCLKKIWRILSGLHLVVGQKIRTFPLGLFTGSSFLRFPSPGNPKKLRRPVIHFAEHCCFLLPKRCVTYFHLDQLLPLDVVRVPSIIKISIKPDN